MKQRFTTILITEQDTDDPATVIDRDALHGQIIDAVQGEEDYGVQVIGAQTIRERWDPETKVYVVE